MGHFRGQGRPLEEDTFKQKPHDADKMSLGLPKGKSSLGGGKAHAKALRWDGP